MNDGCGSELEMGMSGGEPVNFTQKAIAYGKSLVPSILGSMIGLLILSAFGVITIG